MGLNWSAGLMRWTSHKNREGEVFLLDHLHPTRYELAMPAQGALPEANVQIYVGFGLHCFTKKVEQGDCPFDRYSDDRETRTFDYLRYEHSKCLRDVAHELPGRRCSFAKDENYVTIETQSNGTPARYGVFFNVKRWRERGPQSVLVVVQSAYALEPGKPEPGRGSIRFKVLVGHALRGTRPKTP